MNKLIYHDPSLNQELRDLEGISSSLNYNFSIDDLDVDISPYYTSNNIDSYTGIIRNLSVDHLYSLVTESKDDNEKEIDIIRDRVKIKLKRYFDDHSDKLAVYITPDLLENDIIYLRVSDRISVDFDLSRKYILGIYNDCGNISDLTVSIIYDEVMDRFYNQFIRIIDVLFDKYDEEEDNDSEEEDNDSEEEES